MRLLGSLLLAACAFIAPVRTIDWPVVTRVQNLQVTNTTSLACPAIATSAGQQVVVGFSYQGSGTPSVANTGSDTWAQVGSERSEGTNKVRLYKAYNIAGHATDVVTLSITANSATTSISCLVLTMNGTGDPEQGSAGANGSGTSISSGSVTVTSHAVLVGHIVGNGAAIRPSSGFLLLEWGSTSNISRFIGTAIKFVSSSAAVTATQGSATWAVAAGAFTVPATTPTGGGATSGIF